MTNYLWSAKWNRIQLNTEMNEIELSQKNGVKNLRFEDIKSIQKVVHKSLKPQIENPKNWWDKLENSAGKRYYRTPWSKFSFFIIYFNSGQTIIINSLMTNYRKMPFENLKMKYVNFPLIKK
jgi:hypothetical protein